jgi:hypothetical protein
MSEVKNQDSGTRLEGRVEHPVEAASAEVLKVCPYCSEPVQGEGWNPPTNIYFYSHVGSPRGCVDEIVVDGDGIPLPKINVSSEDWESTLSLAGCVKDATVSCGWRNKRAEEAETELAIAHDCSTCDGMLTDHSGCTKTKYDHGSSSAELKPITHRATSLTDMQQGFDEDDLEREGESSSTPQDAARETAVTCKRCKAVLHACRGAWLDNSDFKPEVCPQSGEKAHIPQFPVGSSNWVNQLPEDQRHYIHDLETRCDPTGEVQALRSCEEQREALWCEVEDLKAKLSQPNNGFAPPLNI